MKKTSSAKIFHNKKQQRQFLRDFDLLTQIAPQEKQLYSASDLKKADEMIKDTYVLDQEGQKFRIGCNITQFCRFGPGIYLLFKFLKYSTIAFAILSLFAIINMIVLATSHPQHEPLVQESFKKSLLSTTLEHLSPKNWKTVVGISYTIAVLMTVFVVFWRQREYSYVIQCLKQTSLSSYFTVILKKIPPNYKQRDMMAYLSNLYGQIEQIYTVRNFGDDMLYYKEMNEIVKDYKQEKSLIEMDEKRQSTKLCNLFFEFRNGHFKMKEKIKKDSNYKACFAFIRFKKIEDREKCLQKNQSFFPCFDLLPSHAQTQRQKSDKEEGKIQPIQNNVKPFDDSVLQFQTCQMEPKGILWENIHLTPSAKLAKIFILLGLMLVVLFLSTILIYLLSSVSMTVTNSKFKEYSPQQIQSLNDSFAQWSFCINLPPQQFYHETQICEGYGSEYVKLTLLTLMVPLSISLFKFLLTELMKALVSFRRYAYQIMRIESQATILFVFYFMVTGVLQLIIYLGSDSNSFLQHFTPTLQIIVHEGFSPEKIKLVQDFTPLWYSVAAFNIILIGAISFNLSAFGIIMYCQIRKYLFKKIALRQKIQIQMNKWLEGYQLQIEYIYASALTIIFFTLLFGSAIPILYPLAFIAFLVQYWCYKFIFIRFCKKPLLYNHSINRKSSNMLYIALIIHCFFSPVFFNAPEILSNQNRSFFARLFELWYYFVLLLLVICYATLRKVLISVLKKIRYRKYHKNVEKDKKQADSPANEKNEGGNEDCVRSSCQSQFNTHSQQEPEQVFKERRRFNLPTMVRIIQNKSTQRPYSMHESEGYKEALKILYTINNRQRTRRSLVLNQDLFKMYEDQSKGAQEKSNRCLMEVINVVRKDYNEHVHKNLKQKRNPYESNKRKLYEILLKIKNTTNKKYTINPQNSQEIYLKLRKNGFNVENTQKDTIIEGTTTKEIFGRAKTENLQQIIQEPSDVQGSFSKDMCSEEEEYDVNGAIQDKINQEWTPSETGGRLV